VIVVNIGNHEIPRRLVRVSFGGCLNSSVTVSEEYSQTLDHDIGLAVIVEITDRK